MRYAITAESDGERILKIGQHLLQLWARTKVGVFFWTQCTYNLHLYRFRRTKVYINRVVKAKVIAAVVNFFSSWSWYQVWIELYGIVRGLVFIVWVEHYGGVTFCSRGVREWLSTFPFPPIPIYSIPIPSHPQSQFFWLIPIPMGFPCGLFPFPPIPILSILKLYIISDTVIIIICS